MHALEVKNLNIYTKKGQKKLVDNLCLCLKPAQTLALMGPSGSGKSLTSMAIAKALPLGLYSEAENITFNGLRPALIMQNPADCFDHLFTIKHSINMALIPSQNNVNIEALLKEVGFEQPDKILTCYPFELSGGMLHKVMLAIAIAQVQSNQASFIIADEPIAGLDSTSKLNSLNLLKTLQNKYGFALLYIDHDLRHAKFMADELAIMYHGQIVEQAKFENILASPKHFYTKKLIKTIQSVINSNIPNSTEEPNILTCSKLKKSYLTHGLALKNIDFDLKRGQSIGVVGHNGAGKSTLVRTLLALETLDSGNITILNQHQNTKNQGWRKHIQAVFQHPRMTVNPRMQACDILMEPLQAHGFKANRANSLQVVEELLKTVQLPTNYAKAYPSQMSGGQLQRLCIARALALKPDILILDEPLTDLDSVVAEEILNMLEDIKHKLNMTLLYISHDLRSVLRLCERILVLDQGSIVDDFLSTDYACTKRHVAFQKLLQDSSFT